MRVLALDGGGARGLIQAQLLILLEDWLANEKGRWAPIGEYFDLVVGTSVGGILALAVAQGSSADKIATFLRSAVQDVFPTKRRWRLFAPKYDPAPLMDAASQFFGGNTTLGSIGRTGECPTKPGILVVCQHAHERRTRLLKGAYSKHLAKYANSIKVVDVVRATSAAPLYFPPQIIMGEPLLDGGLVANNPSLIGLLEGAKLLVGQQQKAFPAGVSSGIPEVKLLSIGTGSFPAGPFPVAAATTGGGTLWWLGKLHGQILDSQASHVDYNVMRLMPKDHYVRIDRKLLAPVELDDVAGAIREADSAKFLPDEDLRRLQALFRE